MPTINDYKKSSLKALTGTDGDINTLEYKWLRSVVTPYKGSIPDMWRKYLTALGYTTGSLPDRMKKYLASLGYTGPLNKALYNYWKNGGGVLRNALFGVNLSGPEFAPWNGQTFPSVSDLNYLASKGVGYIRLPIAWESIQPTLNAALDTTYLASITSTIAAAFARNIDTIVEVHNFGAKITTAKWVASDGVVAGYAGNAGVVATGVNFIGDGTLTSAHFADLWSRMATALAGQPGVIGFGIMNEPVQGIVGKNRIQRPNYFTQETGATWFPVNSAVVAQLAEGTNPLGANYGPAWSLTAGGAFAAQLQPVTSTAVAVILSCYAKCSAGTVTGRLYTGDTNGTFTATTSWQRFSRTRTAAAGSANWGVGVDTSGQAIQFANVQLELGGVVSAYEPNQWTPFAQAAIDAIQAVNASVPIYVCGYNLGTAAKWVKDNYELPLLTGTNPRVYEAHQYFDGAQGVGGGGTYSGSYASYSINANQGVDTIDDYLAWAAAKGVTPYLGEFGIPAGADAANWLAVQATSLAALRTAGAKGTSWFYGSNGVQPSNKLNVAAVDDARLLQVLAG